MNISFNWLRQLVRFPADVGPEELGRRLTLRGIAVDAVRPVGVGLRGVIVAEVRGRRPHPKADKLTLVDVFDGAEVTQVVCGAPNVPQPAPEGAPGPRVLWARPGAQLPSGLTLTPKEVRGVMSPGMLCAEDELGLSEDHGGIVVLSPDDGLDIGADFAAAAGLPDWILELDITPNRPDCLGHVGVAREVAAIFAGAGADAGAQLTLPAPDLSPWIQQGDEPAALADVPVEIEDAQGCPRYTARLLTGVTVRPSPLRQRLLLQRLGVRAISNVVDATNLVMLEWGQPLHAFDRDRVEGAVVVRRARPGEALTTLDGQQRALEPGDLLIADRARGLAVAGVMGGQDSEVTAATRSILLESAAFDGASVRRTARRLKLHSEASHRFERGVDPNDGVARASARCCELILRSLPPGEGRVSPRLLDAYPEPIVPRTLRLRPARTRALLGVELSGEEQARLLLSLGMAVAKETAAPGAASGDGEAEALAVTVPTARPDLTREADLIEEVGRLHGLDRVPARLPPLRAGSIGEAPAGNRIADRARDLCRALGLDEIQTFSFVAPERLRVLGFAEGDRRRQPLLLENPLREELSAMRTQLCVGLLEALRHNLSHGEAELRLFEVGEVFLRSLDGAGAALPEERARAAGVLCGHRDHWLKAGAQDQLDFHDLRAIVEELLLGLGVRLQATAGPGALALRAAREGEAPWLHPGVSAVLVDEGGAQRGELGELHPRLREALGIEARAFAFEVDLPQALAPLPVFQPLPRYPGAERDLSFFVDAEVPAGDLVALLGRSGEALLTRVEVLEDYREAGRVPAGKKGLLLGLQYRSPERTLTDEEVQRAHDGVIAHLRKSVEVELR